MQTTDLQEFLVVSSYQSVTDLMTVHTCIGTDVLPSASYVEATLVSGTTIARNGRLEVFYDGGWGSVCTTGWRYSNALVVCRQLGYFRYIQCNCMYVNMHVGDVATYSVSHLLIVHNSVVGIINEVCFCRI